MRAIPENFLRTYISTDKDSELRDMALATGFVIGDSDAKNMRAVRIDPGFRGPRMHPIGNRCALVFRENGDQVIRNSIEWPAMFMAFSVAHSVGVSLPT